MPPTGEEARAQRRATSMPIVWLGFGLMVVAAFTAVLGMHFGVPHAAAFTGASVPQSPAIAPAKVSQ
jgi:hypothetical protein